MVDSYVEAVVVVLLGWRRNKVLKRHVSIWQWIKCGDGAPDRVDTLVRNRASLKRLLGERVDWHSEKTLREVSATLLGCRHIRNPGDAFARARPFIIRKEEGAISFDWATDSSTKLIANVLWF